MYYIVLHQFVDLLERILWTFWDYRPRTYSRMQKLNQPIPHDHQKYLSAVCLSRSRKELTNVALIANIGADTADTSVLCASQADAD